MSDIYQSGRLLALAHRVVLEIAMAMTGSATAILIALELTGKFSQKGLISGLQGFVDV